MFRTCVESVPYRGRLRLTGILKKALEAYFHGSGPVFVSRCRSPQNSSRSTTRLENCLRALVVGISDVHPVLARPELTLQILEQILQQHLVVATEGGGEFPRRRMYHPR